MVGHFENATAYGKTVNPETDKAGVVAGVGHNNPPEATNPLIERLKEKHAEAFATVERVADVAKKAPAEVTDATIAAVVTDIAADAAKLRKKIDDVRAEEKAPFLKAGNDVQDLFKPAVDRLDRIDRALMARVNAWNAKKLAIQRAAERAAREAADRAADEARKREEAAAGDVGLEEAMAFLDDAKPEDAAEPIATPTTTADATRITTASGVTASGQTEWTFAIEDHAKVDLNALRDFLKPDAIEAALRAFVKINKGTKPIAGVRFFEQVVTRRRRG